jgi:aminopeptidase 2
LYLSQHIYSNATTKDLWDAITQVSKKDIPKLMDCWTKQTGYPIVSIKEKSKSNGKIQFEVKQNKFLSSGYVEDETLWNIPLGYITSKNKEAIFVNIDQRVSMVEVDDDIECKLKY